MKEQNIKKLFLATLAAAGLLSFSSCETVEDDDDDDHRHVGNAATTTTTTEETTISRHVPGAPMPNTVETQTIRSY